MSIHNTLNVHAVFILAVGIYICLSDLKSILNTPNPLLQQRTTLYPVDELELVLDKAASGNNKTVIIVMVNKADVEEGGGRGRGMFDLFLESFWEGEDTLPLLEHLLVVATDQTAYERCLFKRLHCYKMETEGIEMMWRRTHFSLDVLRRGYHLVSTDSDVMWLRSPLSRLSMDGGVDMEISVDNMDAEHLINTGFYHVRSNNKTISLFEKWYDMSLNSIWIKEQDVLQNLLNTGYFDKLGVSIGFLKTIEFSGFCQDSTDMSAVTTVHANCCRHLTANVFDLTMVFRDWKRYKASHLNTKWSPHAKCWASLSDNHYSPTV